MINIKSIRKVNEEKAEIIYVKDGAKEFNSKRKIYDSKNKKYKIVYIGGYKFAVKFTKNGFPEIIKELGEYNYNPNYKKQAGGKDDEDFESLEGVEIKIPALQEEKKVIEVAEKIKEEIKEKTPVIKHKKFDEIKTLVESNVPVYLYGPAGSGKNHVLQQIAEENGLDFYFTNSVQQEYKITGFIDAGGKYHETEFYNAWTKGGLFFLDEMDASIPEVLILLNAALANGYFDFPGHGKIDAHKDFRVVAAGNTVGTGADEQYTGRLQLDQATLDRFWFIEFDYDQNIELAISNYNKELVEFVRDLRKQAKDKGINATFSYRCITMVTKMENKMDLKVILMGAVLKGLDKDTINTFTTTSTNKYSKALWMIKQAA